MDTKYFEAAVNEYCLKRSMHIKVGDLTMGELSGLMRRAHELWVEDGKPRPEGAPQPIAHLLEHAEEIR